MTPTGATRMKMKRESLLSIPEKKGKIADPAKEFEELLIFPDQLYEYLLNFRHSYRLNRFE